jgi:hypothetical protein
MSLAPALMTIHQALRRTGRTLEKKFSQKGALDRLTHALCPSNEDRLDALDPARHACTSLHPALAHDAHVRLDHVHRPIAKKE